MNFPTETKSKFSRSSVSRAKTICYIPKLESDTLEVISHEISYEITHEVWTFQLKQNLNFQDQVYLGPKLYVIYRSLKVTLWR